ncbi:cyclic AMP-dependent transcription factor ATF-6 alpha isoform X1 [Parasteatoda tepidariorum]|uniref:cyclic AMP-dependent transcription factor ATF-6 alpha isoform X1 n=1 Tax=Parasteatoda tepidariorum TaxID=114398 RepID=UPI001C71BF36|nr:cyclic AMP-dependent transcription factor ATF-6 alpha isoform X1 [Parasteatoda tepidariorum]
MALKMMTLNSIDKQFIDDNMLTDEDFLCADDSVQLSYEDLEVLNEISRHYQLPSAQDQVKNGVNASQDDSYCKSLDEFFQDYITDESENSSLSTNFPSGNQDVYAPQSNTSVISIPDENQCYEVNNNGADTPPRTPSESSDSSIGSPISQFHQEPVIVSLNSLPQITYVLPSNNQVTIKSSKPPITIKPKLIQSKAPAYSSNVISAATKEPLIKLPCGVFQVKSPTSPSSNQKRCDISANKIKRKLSTDTELIGLCEMALKRQTRIMKNRESASLSRKKKKAYVEKLEADLSQITAENSCLKNENNQLKLKITDLEKELSKLKAAFSSKALKKTACFMVVLFIMTINLTPFNNIFDKVPVDPQKSVLENHRVGRILLWNEENRSRELNDSEHFFSDRYIEEVDPSYIVSWEKSYNSSCHQFINKSESIRLEKDLLGWVKRVEKKQKQTESNFKTDVFDMKSALPPLPKLHLKPKLARENSKDIWAKKKNRNEILIYQTPRKAYEDFFDAIHRRDDSFYFISFSGDHLLLPAIAHNQTLRPRMSFVMPAMTLNDSVDSEDYISMMQIDCEVIDTKLVSIKESVIPSHLRQKHNNTSKPSSKNRSRFTLNKNSKQLHTTRTVNSSR